MGTDTHTHTHTSLFLSLSLSSAFASQVKNKNINKKICNKISLRRQGTRSAGPPRPCSTVGCAEHRPEVLCVEGGRACLELSPISLVLFRRCAQ